MYFNPVARTINSYKSRHFPFTPRKDYRQYLLGLASELAELRNIPNYFDLLDDYFSFYCYLILNPLKAGKFRYICPSGKVVKLDHEPFYVGKGQGNRMFHHLKEAANEDNINHKVNTIRKIWKAGLEPIIIDTASRVSDVMACAFEIDLIAGIGRRNKKSGPLVNLTDGGEGATGLIHSEEYKIQQSIRMRKITLDLGITETFSFKGKTRTIREWAKETGINADTIRNRLRSNWSQRKIITTPLSVSATPKVLTYKDSTKTLAEWAREYKIPKGTLAGRLRRGETIENIFAPRKCETITRISFKGKILTIAEWSLELGIPEDTIYARYTQGKTTDQVLYVGNRSSVRPQKTLTYKDRTQTLNAWAKELGIGRHVICQRIKKKWPLDDVLSPILNFR